MPDYCKYHTGAVINTTIRLFTHTSLELRDDTKVTFKWINKDEFEEHDFSDDLDCSYGLKLFKATPEETSGEISPNFPPLFKVAKNKLHEKR